MSEQQGHRLLGCTGYGYGEHRGCHGVQLRHVAPGSPAAPSYRCDLKTPSLGWHLSFPSPSVTPSSKRLGGGWGGGVRAGRESPYSQFWGGAGGSTAALQREDSSAAIGMPSTAALGSEGSELGLFINFPAQLKEDRELCPCFYTLFICFYSSYCCSPSASFTAFQMGESITSPQHGAWV